MSRFPLIALACCALAWGDTYPRQQGIDVQHYVFGITVNDDNDEVAGETTVVVRFVKDSVTEIALDLASATDGKGMTVTGVTSSGTAVLFVHQFDRLILKLPSAPPVGDLRRYAITYRGVPSAGLKALRNKYGERCFFSANWPDLAHQWLPVIDHPYDKATGEFIVTAPARYQVVANGILVEELDLGDGRRTTRWKQSIPIATWLYNVGIAQFASRTFGAAAGVPLQTWVNHQDRDAGIGTFEEPMRQAIEFYNDHVGPYPYEKLAAVQWAGGNGAMEHASAIFYGERVVNGKPASGLVAHETAHQWFGDSVTEKDWDDVWLSEGFATYFALLTAEHYEGRDAFIAGLKRSRASVFNAEKRMPGVAVVQDRHWKGIPNAVVYQKGGWTLHVLRGEIGTEKFWAGIREYYRRYRDRNASTQDFRKVMEEAAGTDLGWFFQQWTYRAGSPVVQGSWKYNPETKRVEIELEQKQEGDAFRLPLEVGVQGKIEKVLMTRKQQSFQLFAEKEPSSVELDPNTWILMDAHFEKR